jgi:hypothetical protein
MMAVILTGFSPPDVTPMKVANDDARPVASARLGVRGNVRASRRRPSRINDAPPPP